MRKESSKNLISILCLILLCVNANKEFIKAYIKEIEQEDIKNVLALRGDKPNNSQNADFKYAYELVKYIKQNTSLCIAVAGYPEGHSEAESLNKDVENLKRKIDNGGQIIYNNVHFLIITIFSNMLIY